MTSYISNINKITSEIIVNNGMTDNRIYNFVLTEIFDNDIIKTDRFMLSKKMGYTRSDLYVIKRKQSTAKRLNWLKEHNQRMGNNSPAIF